MSPMSPRVRAGLVLLATLLPLCTFAAPLRIQLVRVDSSVTDVPELSPQALEERSLYGLTQATQLEPGKAVLVRAGAPEAPEVLVGAKLARSGMKFRLVYTVQTLQLPRLSKQLAYEFGQPRLSDRGVTVMAQEIIAEGVKLEEARKSRAAEQAPAPVAEAPPPPPTPSAASNEPEYEELPQEEFERRRAEWKEARKPRQKLDLGLAAGFNSPSGVFGLEAEYRPIEHVGLNLSGGTGAWGTRISTLARLYPLGAVRASPFLEGGLSLNMGGEATVSVNNEPVQIVDQLMTPVATASVGTRFLIAPIYFTPRVGWGFRLRNDYYRARDGSEVDPLLDTVLRLSQHGGFLISLTVGATFL